MDAMLTIGLPMPVMIKLTHACQSAAVGVQCLHGWCQTAATPNTWRLRRKRTPSQCHTLCTALVSRRMDASVPAQHTVVSGAVVADGIVLKQLLPPPQRVRGPTSYYVQTPCSAGPYRTVPMTPPYPRTPFHTPKQLIACCRAAVSLVSTSHHPVYYLHTAPPSTDAARLR